jgi:hypothetical protein
MAATVAVAVAEGFGEIEAGAWDACANPSGEPFNPFVSHAFLSSLEESGSAVARTGWRPRHLLLKDGDGTLLAAAPCYQKSHSRGEYVFDHGWAEAWHRAGGRYYPKLQMSVPFTPVTGPRLLAPPGPERDARRLMLAGAAITLAERIEASSVHLTFLTEDEARLLRAPSWLSRIDTQFHWLNQGYGSFDDFLARLSSRKRKMIRKERARAVEEGLVLEWVTGSAITEAHWDAFFAFYMDTGSRKWGSPYLTRAFFSLIGERMAEHTLLVMVKRGGRYVAGALNFIGSDALYGRHWGAIEHHEFLHFEACYYQAIEFAIGHGLARVEAGAQGPHKLARGYLPVETRSAHHIRNAAFARAVADYLRHEREAVGDDIAQLASHSPFRRGETDNF